MRKIIQIGVLVHCEVLARALSITDRLLTLSKVVL